MGGAAPRTRSLVAGRAPPAGGACAVLAAAAPLHSPRGYRGALAPPRCRLFRQLGFFLLSSPVAARQPRSLAAEPPARRVCAVSVAVAAGPAPPSLLGLVSVSRPSPQARRLVRLSVHPSVRFCALRGSCQRSLCGPQSPLVRPSPPTPLSAARTGIRSLLPSSPALCACCHRPVPSVTSVSITLQLGMRDSVCSLRAPPPNPGVGMGSWRLSPPTPRLGGTGHPVTLRSPPVVCRLLRRPV